MLIFDPQTGDLISREPNQLCSFGLIEGLAAVLVGVGIGAETAAIAAPVIIGGLSGAGLGAGTAALTGGDPGKGALFGGLGGAAFGGLGAVAGELGGAGGAAAGGAGGAADAGLGLSAGFASDSAIAGGAGGGIGGGELGAATGGALGAETGATFADSLVPATFGTGGGAIDAGAFGASAAGDVAPGIAAAPGISAGADVPLSGFGGAAPTAPGPGSAAFAPPTLASGTPTVDLTGSFGANAGLADTQGGNLFTAATTGASDTAAPAASESALTAPGALDPGITDPSAVLNTATGGSPTPPPGGGGAINPATGDVIPVPSNAATGAFDPVTGQEQSGWLARTLGKAGDYIAENPLKAAATGVSALGLGRNLLTANQPNPIPGMADLAAYAKSLGQTGTGLIAPNAINAGNVAGNATAQAKTLENYLTTGTLPPAVQASLDRATNSAITNIKAKYASKGMPPGSTPEQQEIASIKQSSIIQGGTLAAQLYSQGASEEQLAAGIYEHLVGSGVSAAGQGVQATDALLRTNVSLNNATNQAIANLSNALGGGRGIRNTDTAVAA